MPPKKLPFGNLTTWWQTIGTQVATNESALVRISTPTSPMTMISPDTPKFHKCLRVNEQRPIPRRRPLTPAPLSLGNATQTIDQAFESSVPALPNGVRYTREGSEQSVAFLGRRYKRHQQTTHLSAIIHGNRPRVNWQLQRSAPEDCLCLVSAISHTAGSSEGRGRLPIRAQLGLHCS